MIRHSPSHGSRRASPLREGAEGRCRANSVGVDAHIDPIARFLSGRYASIGPYGGAITMASFILFQHFTFPRRDTYEHR